MATRTAPTSKRWAGWGGLTCNPEFGGLPHTLSVFVEEMLQSSNMALSLYATARFFARRLLPNTASLLLTLRAGADTVMAMEAEAF